MFTATPSLAASHLAVDYGYVLGVVAFTGHPIYRDPFCRARANVRPCGKPAASTLSAATGPELRLRSWISSNRTGRRARGSSSRHRLQSKIVCPPEETRPVPATSNVNGMQPAVDWAAFPHFIVALDPRRSMRSCKRQRKRYAMLGNKPAEPSAA